MRRAGECPAGTVGVAGQAAVDGLRRLLPSGNALSVFDAAARESSFSRAAAEMNVTQPAVIRMIGRLDRHLDAALFARGPDGVALTEEGRILHTAVAA